MPPPSQHLATSVWLLGESSIKHDDAGGTRALRNLLHPLLKLNSGKEDRSTWVLSHRFFLGLSFCHVESICIGVDTSASRLGGRQQWIMLFEQSLPRFNEQADLSSQPPLSTTFPPSHNSQYFLEVLLGLGLERVPFKQTQVHVPGSVPDPTPMGPTLEHLYSSNSWDYPMKVTVPLLLFILLFVFIVQEIKPKTLLYVRQAVYHQLYPSLKETFSSTKCGLDFIDFNMFGGSVYMFSESVYIKRVTYKGIDTWHCPPLIGHGTHVLILTRVFTRVHVCVHTHKYFSKNPLQRHINLFLLC